ncbi:DUF4177 domain-containing protein [Lysobacter sp. H21R4]|uniref:DUF4177 domain-containing protein n=1 Tax=Lysobacter sp. H21R4 TaxID=2781021 RepID=UPI0018882C36|nr:DUF4177 domain-containing protein [Lysobacter sp. H21R4]QOY62211.1 DUF4177 domain-containing protein [Lysobacter sp. H21R4]
MSDQWSYKVLELKPKLLGGSVTVRLEEELNRLGKLGWELVSVTHMHFLEPIRCFLKKEN